MKKVLPLDPELIAIGCLIIMTRKTNYDLIAHLYPGITGALFIFGGVLEDKFRRKAYQETLPLKGNECLLDICSATGKGTRILASMLTKGGEVFGIDNNPAMIAFAYKYSKKYSNVHYRVGDCANIPFQNESFHVTSAVLALHELPTTILPMVLKEVKRVLKSMGYFYILDFTMPKNPNFRQRFIYYCLRLVEDESAARFMLMDQASLMEKYGFYLLYQKKYLGGFLTASLYQLQK
ncbi:MAG: methyltransferase domain-containing protein [Candidatus Heimdallarchaeota archaeon]|nr:methyltransferase domain-containing protein [Candidatus Heimdallarchaeota archaeon]